MSHIFLSYSHVDQAFVNDLEPLIEDSGFEVWTDRELIPGENWRKGIDDAIKKAFAVIVIMTPSAQQSQYVAYEWAYALGVGKKVIPVLFQETALHPRLEELQYIDFTEGPTAPLNRLLKRLAELELSAIYDALKKPRYNDRLAAVQTLAERGEKDAVPHLIRRLRHDRSKIVRAEVAKALQKIGTKKALDALKTYEEGDENPR